MTDSDYNIIRSAEALQNVGGPAPGKYRNEKNKRRNLRKQNNREPDPLKDEPDDSKGIENEPDAHSIDYRA